MPIATRPVKLNLKEVQKALVGLDKQFKNWTFRYDKDLDYFYGNKSKISKQSVLIHPDKEFGFYLNPSGKVEGFVFEYYFSNFVKHNDRFKEFETIVKENKLSDKSKPKVKHFLEDLSTKMISEVTELEVKQKS